MSAPVKMICVLRTGGDFAVRHVLRLFDQVAAHAAPDVDLLCLTDDAALLGADFARPLIHDWLGFFAKVEAFSVPGPALYLDLDVNILGDLAPLVQAVREHDFIVLRDFGIPNLHGLNTSAMGWRGDVSSLYRSFAINPGAQLARYADPRRCYEPGRGWGDQGFVRDHWSGAVAYWQDILEPGAVASFKADVKGAGINRDRTIVVCSHGKPRPWEPGGADECLMRTGTSSSF